MKAFQGFVSTAIALSAIASANAAALNVREQHRSHDDASLTQAPSTVVASALPSASGVAVSAAPSASASTTDAVIPSSTGGFVVTGIYTTCLTLTFAAPTATPIVPVGSDAPVSSAVVASGSSTTPVSSDVPLPSGSGGPFLSAPTSTDTDTPPAITPSGVNPGGPIIPDPTSVVFTTCLAFLPTDTATATPTDTGIPTDTAVPTGSVVASASAFPSAAPSTVPSAGDPAASTASASVGF
ncbi:hypothetical protein GGX14DRAFT_441251 [Mycena pura]|uniref:Uncharacterized protein n=1 Tax=Mycena pura TaxID=153505 RepID=A0AAD6YGR4_9AGAR|nr:hypothetical protein GGX14DRAFT_441251 [Mycena pura]